MFIECLNGRAALVRKVGDH